MRSPAASYAVQVNGYNSATGDIVLNNPPVGSPSGVPVITDEPDDTTVLIGTPFQLNVTAQGANVGYEWLFNDTPIAGATASHFRVESATLADAGAYRVQVTNGQGSASSRAATVTVERVRAEPGNDNFNAATEISGSGRVTGANRLTSAEPGEPNHAGVSNPLASVWYRYTAPSAGTLAVNTAGSNFDTVLAAYTGDAVAQLIQVAANDDSNGGRQSGIALPVTAGGIYYLVVDGYNAAEGDITLGLQLRVR